MSGSHAPVAIVGAGPTGLAAAAVLKERGVESLLLERSDAVGESWRRRYERLHLHTVRWLSGLPGLPIERSAGKWVPKDAYAEYLVRYAGHHGLEPRLGVEAQRIERTDGTWTLLTSDGDVPAERVVVASGFSARPYVPDWPGRETFGDRLVHSAAYVDPAPYAGLDVLVVGSGNSGAEIAADVAEAGAARVRISVRTPPIVVRRDTLGIPSQLLGIALGKLPVRVVVPVSKGLRRISIPDLAPYGLPAPPDGVAQFARTGTVPILDVGFVAAVRSGRVEVVPAVERFEGGAVVLADGSRSEPDAVIAATGFSPGLEPLVGHLGVLDERGIPLVSGGQTHPGAPGLYFAALQPRLSGLLREAAKDAKRVAAAISTGTRGRRAV
jgi:cation diffusion facilitator CzcD-associated flavoprotein CzcO